MHLASGSTFKGRMRLKVPQKKKRRASSLRRVLSAEGLKGIPLRAVRLWPPPAVRGRKSVTQLMLYDSLSHSCRMIIFSFLSHARSGSAGSQLTVVRGITFWGSWRCLKWSISDGGSGGMRNPARTGQPRRSQLPQKRKVLTVEPRFPRQHSPLIKGEPRPPLGPRLSVIYQPPQPTPPRPQTIAARPVSKMDQPSSHSSLAPQKNSR